MNGPWSHEEVAKLVIAHNQEVSFEQLSIYLGRSSSTCSFMYNKFSRNNFPAVRTIAIREAISKLYLNISELMSDIEQCDCCPNTPISPRFLMGFRPPESSNEYTMDHSTILEKAAIQVIENSNMDVVAFKLTPMKLETTTVVTKKLV